MSVSQRSSSLLCFAIWQFMILVVACMEKIDHQQQQQQNQINLQNKRQQQEQAQLEPTKRKLASEYLFEDDVCYDEELDVFGPCNPNKFPNCSGDEEICYNRRPRRDLFYTDIRQPYYAIHYRSVFCYPKDWGCSSCSPGRYCVSEKRCILDELSYPCAKWL